MNIKRWEIWLASLDPSFGTEGGWKNETRTDSTI